jgi:hypothetical protein
MIFPRGVWGEAQAVQPNLYFIDSNRIRRVNLNSGIISHFAGNANNGYAMDSASQNGDGGQATAAILSAPVLIWGDSSNALVIADCDNNKIRQTDSAGIITTIAGTGQSDSSGDGDRATSAGVSHPYAVFVSDSGTVYIVEQLRHIVRKISKDDQIVSIYAG